MSQNLLLTLAIPDGAGSIVIVSFAPDSMCCALIIDIHFEIITEREAESITEDIGKAADAR
jgi:hypothetical protein